MIEFLKKRSRSLLEKGFSKEGITFKFKGKAAPIFPLCKNDPQILSQLLPEGAAWSALEHLWSEGLLKESGPGNWLSPFTIYEVIGHDEDREVLMALGLAEPTDLDLRMLSISNVGDPAFRIRIEASHPSVGPLREGDPPRFGSVFLKDSNTIIPLVREQQILFDETLGHDVDWSQLEDRMAYLARCKDLGLKAGAKLDGYLLSEEYEFRSDAQLDLREDSEKELTVIPIIQGGEDYGIDSSDKLAGGKIRKVFTSSEPRGKRKRLVIDKSLRERLERLPKRGKFTGQDVPRLLTNPEQVLPEGFDLSLFSKRVKGVKTRVYNSRPYIHVSKTKGGWFEGIPGVEIEDWSPGEQTDQAQEEKRLESLSPDTYREIARRAEEEGSEYILHQGAWIRVDPDAASRFDDTIEKFEKNLNGSIRIPAGAILDIFENLALLEFIDIKSLPEDPSIPADLPQVEPPEGFSGVLYPYQLLGYRWLTRLSNLKLGGLLADDMGLGKTVQAIAHLAYLKESGINGPHLIVVPKTLIENWRREISKFSNGALSVWCEDAHSENMHESFYSGFDVVLTTYEVLRRKQVRLGTVPWKMVLCDEAQYIKNPTTARTSAVKAMKSKFRAALTGTPVENGLIEFWCIMDFVQPGLLGSWLDIKKKYERPIVAGEETEREKHVTSLLSEIKGHYLRRMKSEYLKELPQKKIEIIKVGLSQIQLSLYRQVARAGKIGGKGAALAAIQKLLLVSAHPHAMGGGICPEEEDIISVCPKLKETIDVITTVKSAAEKIIVFTDFKAVQRILQKAIMKRFGIWADILNGEITDNRQTVIDIFSEKSGFNVLILGHQVGGVGLNITAANHVIHYTRPWNPAKENQATDRVHRIGQTKPVTVYYPIVKNESFVTVEQRLAELIKSKEELARDVLRPSSELGVKPEELLDCIEEALL